MIRFHQAHQLLNIPDVIGETRLHGGCYPQRFVNPAEIVIHEMQGNSSFMVGDLLGDNPVAKSMVCGPYGGAVIAQYALVVWILGNTAS
jgi:hypothetical protein